MEDCIFLEVTLTPLDHFRVILLIFIVFAQVWCFLEVLEKSTHPGWRIQDGRHFRMYSLLSKSRCHSFNILGVKKGGGVFPHPHPPGSRRPKKPGLSRVK